MIKKTTKGREAEAALRQLHEDDPAGVGAKVSAGDRVGSADLKRTLVWTWSAGWQDLRGCHIGMGSLPPKVGCDPVEWIFEQNGPPEPPELAVAVMRLVWGILPPGCFRRASGVYPHPPSKGYKTFPWCPGGLLWRLRGALFRARRRAAEV